MNIKSTIKKCLLLLSMLTFAFGLTACNKVDVSTFSQSDILVSICIVLLAVIFLAVMITSSIIIKKIQYNESNMRSDKSVLGLGVENTIAQIIQKEKDEINNMELVAVITAAIAAAEGTSSDAFVVRSIKRSNKNKWQRA